MRDRPIGDDEAVSDGDLPDGWLPKADFDAIYSRVPRLCVEVILHDAERGIVLALRDIPPNVGAWHIPGGTVLYGEPVVDAVRRVARMELGLEVEVGELLGYIEYPSHVAAGIDSPVGIAFRASPIVTADAAPAMPDNCAWFTELPPGLYAEQREFLTAQLGLTAAG